VPETPEELYARVRSEGLRMPPRPARFPQLIGNFAAIWDDILPPTPQKVWDDNLALVVSALSE
jgi:hypothetical protein